MNKKILLLCLLAAGMFCYIPTTVKAETSEDGEWDYEVTGDETVAVYGYNGTETKISVPSSIDGYTVTSIKKDPNYGYTGAISYAGVEEITVPNSVIYIEDGAFSDEQLEKIIIPESVSNIGSKVFQNCTNLVNIEVDSDNECYSSEDGVLYDKMKYRVIKCPEAKEDVVLATSIYEIGEYALCNCVKLKEVIVPEGVTQIGNNAFHSCENLERVEIPNTVTQIGRYAFYYCKQLESVEIPTGVTDIDEYTFYNCTTLTSVEIPDTVINIGEAAFAFCEKLEAIEIPFRVESIREDTFRGCSSLTDINIPTSVTIIEDYAFSDCHGLTEVELPVGINNLAANAFSNCSKLENINVAAGNLAYSSENGVLYNKDKTVLLLCPSGKETVNISTKTETIYQRAFNNCDLLISIEIPSNITNIENSAFRDCDALTTVKMSENITCISDGIFSGCDSLVTINIPNNVTTIESCAFFECISLVNIEIPNSVTSIEYGAFYGCENLLSVKLPDNLEVVEAETFFGCSKLNYVEIPKSVWGIEEDAFSWCDSLVIYGYVGSYAERFATVNNIPFVALEKSEKEPTKDVVCEGNTETAINTDEDKLLEMIFTEDELEMIDNGSDVYIKLEVNDVTTNVSNADKNTIQNALPNGYNVEKYFDIKFWAKLGDINLPVTETNGMVEIAINIPLEETGTYKVIRVHDDKAEILPSEIKDGKLVFSTDKFSTYAIIHSEAPVDIDTGNNLRNEALIVTTIVLLIATIGISSYRKK